MKHQEIKFEPRTGYGLTSVCPHGGSVGHTSIYVGSISCQNCKHNAGTDLKEGRVTCSFHGDMADKAMSAKEDRNA